VEPDGKQDMVVGRQRSRSKRVLLSRTRQDAQKKRDPGKEAKFFDCQVARAATEAGRHFGLFDFPTVSRQFDVTRKTIIMNVSEGPRR
jgi:hypothetical protein